MKTRRLGDSDLLLTEIGFGAWAIGGVWQFGWGPVDDRESIAAIHAALDAGINWIDTAAVYGFGHSEEVVGQAIRGRRDDVIIATKCSMAWNEKKKVIHSLKADSVRGECESSLRRLGVDVIDLYQIHWPRDEMYIEEGWETLAKLKEEGKIRFAGVSNFNVEQLKRCEQIAPVTSLQPPYNLCRREVEGSILPYCGERNIGVVAYSPMGSGLLSGKWTADRVDGLDATDWRRNNPLFSMPKVGEILEKVDKTRSIAEKYDKTVAQLSVAWTLKRPELTAAIVGARRADQIKETVGAAGLEIAEEDYQKLCEIFD